MNRKMMMAIAAVVAMGAAYAKAGSQNDAGCGAGSMLIRDNIAWKQVFAATTNGSFGIQTFAISTGTSGCQSGGLSKTSMARRNFVASNYRDLSREIAMGRGEHVVTLASLMGCTDSGAFSAFAQSKYQALFPTAEARPEAMLQNLQSAISQDKSMSASCSI